MELDKKGVHLRNLEAYTKYVKELTYFDVDL